MTTSLALAVVLLLAGQSALAVPSPSLRPQAPLRLTAGQTYEYAYRSRVMTGIPGLAQQYAGLEIEASVLISGLSAEVAAMKIAGIRVGKHNGPVGGDFPAGQSPIVDHEAHAQLTQQLQKAVRFVYQDGKVKAFEADQSEPEWSLNMKKAVLSLFQLDLAPKKVIRAQTPKQQLQQLIQRPLESSQLTVYPVYEEGVGGLCETVYELTNQPSADHAYSDSALVLNVTKTRNYDNCLTEPLIVNDNYDVRGCPWACRKDRSFAAVAGYFPTPDAVTDAYMSGCPCGKEPHDSPVDAYAFYKYNISLVGGAPLIEGVYQEGKTAYRTFGAEILVLSQQKLTLVASSDRQTAPQLFQIARPQRHNELSFRLPKPVLPSGANAGYKLPLDIPYYHLFGAPEPEELKALIPELLDSLASDVLSEEIGATAEQIGQKSVQLVNAMAVLSQHALQQLYAEVAQEGAGQRATPKQQVVRKLFLDALPLAGSNDAALAVKTLVAENAVTTWEAKEMVEAVPQNLFLPDAQTIDAYLELYTSPRVQNRRHLAASTGIAFGKMVKEACVKRAATPGDIPDQQLPHPKRNAAAQMVVAQALPQSAQRVTIAQKTLPFSQRMKRSPAWEQQFTQDVCDNDDVRKYVQIITRLLTAANTFHQKVALIETLAHMGVPEVLPALEPYISGSALQSGQCPGYPVEERWQEAQECHFVRQVAIYALAHVAENYPKQVAPLVQPVYSDRSQPYEVRIAAFTTLVFAAPDKQVLERIASELHFENNRQVKAFVYSSLHTIANISAPCFQHVAQHAQAAIAHAPHADFGYQFSQMKGDGFFFQDKDFGLYSLAEWTASNISRVPRAGYFSVGQSEGPFQDELLQVGFNAKGMQPIVDRIFSGQLFADAFQGMRSKTRDRRINRRNADTAQALLEALKSKLKFATRADEEPKATLFFKLFDRTSYYALDKHFLHAALDAAEDSLKDLVQELMQGQQFQYVKMVMPAQLYKVVPSELGLPVVISHRHPLILSLKVEQAKLQVEVSPKTVIPVAANATAQVTPSVFYSSQTFAFALNPADRQAYGAHVHKTTQAQFPAEVTVGYSRPNNLVTWSLIPKLAQNQQIVYHKTQASTFIAKASISGAPDSDWLQEAQELKAQATPFLYDDTWGQQQTGLGVRVQMTSEDVWSAQPITSGQTYEQHGIVAALLEAWRNPGLKAREVHVTLEADEETPSSGFDFSLKYKWIEDSEQTTDSDDSDESSQSDESDSDQSDESSESESSESASSDSQSESSDESSESSQSSEASDSQSQEKNAKKASELKKRINHRIKQNISANQRSKRSSEKNAKNKESNESSDESSNESKSQSFSKSNGKESSQSSSSESRSSEEKHSDDDNQSASAQSSESDSSSSSASDESQSFEDAVFDYEDVMQLILGQDFKRRDIKKIAKALVKKTVDVWSQNWAQEQESPDPKSQKELSVIPQTIAHDVVFTAVARGPRPTYYALNVLYVHTYDHRVVWLKSDAHVKAPKGVYVTQPTLFCADAVVAFPQLPNEFYYEPQMAAQQARVQASLGWGQQCRSEGGVLVTGVMEQTEDHVVTQDQFAPQDGQGGAQVQNWYFAQCQIDRAEGRPQSYACERAVIASAYFNQFVFDVKYKGVPKEVQNLTRKADLALKVALYEHADVDYDADNADDQIRVVAQFSQRVPDVPLVDLEIRSPSETAQYAKIHAPYVRPVSSLLKTKEVFANLFSNFDYESQCHLMPDFVRTFDNVTYQIPYSPCQFLLAKDCSPKERFAVFAQTLDESVKTKTLTVVTQGQQIQLQPPQQQSVAQVVIDGRAHELTFRQPITLLGDNNNLRIYLRATPSAADNPIIVLEADLNDLKVTFDGKSAKVTVGGQYQGRTCGLCGDNNDETDDEFAGPDRCLYAEAEDFANAYALSGQHCEQTPQPKGFKRCPQNDIDDSDDDYDYKKEKTVIVASGPHGESQVVRQQIFSAQDQEQRAQEIQSQANLEELAANRQKMAERQMARQDGQPVAGQQEQQLIAGSAQNQKLIERLRTQYIARDEMMCFSTKPYLSCVAGVSRAQAVRDLQVDFHCLPKSSPFTQKMIEDIDTQYKVIKQLVNKRVDLRQVLQVPTACQAL